MSLKSSYHDTALLLQHFKEGRNPALRAVYELHYHSLFCFANRVIQDEMAAEGILAECFIKLWRRRQEFESLKGIASFPFMVTRNASFSYLSSKKKEPGCVCKPAYLNGGSVQELGG